MTFAHYCRKLSFYQPNRNGQLSLQEGGTCIFNSSVISKSFLFSCERKDFRLLFDLSGSMIGILLFLRHFAWQRGFQLTNV